MTAKEFCARYLLLTNTNINININTNTNTIVLCQIDDDLHPHTSIQFAEKTLKEICGRPFVGDFLALQSHHSYT